MALGLDVLKVPNRKGISPLGEEQGRAIIPMTMYGIARDLESTPEVEGLKDELRQKYKLLKATKEYENLEHPVLRNYQVADVGFILAVDHPLVANEMRLGKTLTTCFALKELGMKALVVAPASVLHQWADEAYKAGLTSGVAQGTPKKREKAYLAETDIVLVSYESMRNDKDLIKAGRFEVLVADEVHRIGNHKTKAHKVLVEIGSGMYKRIGLTGTPIYGDVTRLYGVLRFIYPKFFRSYWGFVNRYLNVIEGYWGNEINGFNPKRQPELEELMANFMIQRKQVDHLHWLSKPIRYDVPVQMTRKERKDYNELWETMELEERDWDAQMPLVLEGMLQKLTLEAKIREVEDILVEGEPTILFVKHSSYIPELVNKLLGMGYSVYELHGTMTPSAKKRNIIAFQNSQSERRVIVCNITSAGTGVTLSSATRTIFLEQSWIPEENKQAAERMTGGEAAKALYYLHVEDSVDEKVIEVVTGKKTRHDVINEMRRKFE